MARPKKENADYFSHDADMRNDNKIKAVRRKFGLKGYAIWCMILEHLTDCNNFDYEITDLNIELMAGDFDIDPIELKEIINYFISLKLLEEDCNFIYSNQLLKRFDSLLNKRKLNRNAYKNEFQTPETPNKGVSDVENPQSKVKEIKVKEIKVNESKVHNSAYEFLKFENLEEIEAFEMQNKNSFKKSNDYAAFIENFNNKVTLEGIPYEPQKLFARLRMLNANWDKNPIAKDNKKEKQTGAQAFKDLVYGVSSL